MTLHSMTGFARATGQAEGSQWSWEIKCVNGRGLDLKFRLPTALESIETRARQAVGLRIQRGNVQIQLTLVRPPRPPQVRINTELLASLQRSLIDAGFAQTDAPIDLAAMMAIRGVVSVEESIEDGDLSTLVEPVLESFDAALAGLVTMRLAEGAQLRTVLLDRIDMLHALVQKADALPGRRPEAIRARLSAQVMALITESGTFDPARLHQEAVLIAAKADIREELDRLYAHCAAARSLLETGGPVGRKLDFLSQEFVREANTLCAKSNDVDLTAIGLDLKAIIEQLREQVQNIE
jgi:uncharacterized protein (TIGR00255 family)